MFSEAVIGLRRRSVDRYMTFVLCSFLVYKINIIFINLINQSLNF